MIDYTGVIDHMELVEGEVEIGMVLHSKDFQEFLQLDLP